MALRTSVDWVAVASGAAVAVVVGVLVSVVAVAVGVGQDSNAIFAFYLVDLVGGAVGGWLAARRRLDTPLMHGALAALAAYVVIAVVSSAINVAAGHGFPRPAALIFNAFMLTAAGVAGGYVVSWRAPSGTGHTP